MWDSDRERDDQEARAARVERQKLSEERYKLKEERQQLSEDRKCPVGFMASAVLPGENQAAFDQLVEQLRREYQPVGIAQEDALRTMAQAIWRKHRLAIFQRAAEARTRWGAYFSHPNDQGGAYAITRDMLAEFAGEIEKRMKFDADTNEQQQTATPLTESRTDGPREEVKSTSAFADIGSVFKVSDALKDIDEAFREALPPPPRESEIVASHVQTQVLLALAGNLLTPECYLAELRMIEQLDRVIERSHNRLMKMKKDFKANKAPPNKASSPTSGWAIPRR